MGWMSRLAGAWPLVLLGARVDFAGGGVVRLLVPVYRRPIFGTLMLRGISLSASALGDLVNWGVLWAGSY